MIDRGVIYMESKDEDYGQAGPESSKRSRREAHRERIRMGAARRNDAILLSAVLAYRLGTMSWRKAMEQAAVNGSIERERLVLTLRLALQFYEDECESELAGDPPMWVRDARDMLLKK